uniref:Uncharacterized protein n=1 Tax=Rhizophora mucronata TaxID=61149 RepID=A0A2P2Q4T0_RHIMU
MKLGSTVFCVCGPYCFCLFCLTSVLDL